MPTEVHDSGEHADHDDNEGDDAGDDDGDDDCDVAGGCTPRTCACSSPLCTELDESSSAAPTTENCTEAGNHVDGDVGDADGDDDGDGFVDDGDEG